MENVSRDEVGRLKKPLGLFFVIYNFLWTNVNGKSYVFFGFRTVVFRKSVREKTY